MEEDFEIMPNLLDRRRLKDRIIENISKAVKNVRFWITFQEEQRDSARSCLVHPVTGQLADCQLADWSACGCDFYQ